MYVSSQPEPLEVRVEQHRPLAMLVRFDVERGAVVDVVGQLRVGVVVLAVDDDLPRLDREAVRDGLVVDDDADERAESGATACCSVASGSIARMSSQP